MKGKSGIEAYPRKLWSKLPWEKIGGMRGASRRLAATSPSW